MKNNLLFCIVLVLLLCGVHVLNKPLSRNYDTIGKTVLGDSVRIDHKGDGKPYIVRYDGLETIRYSREAYLEKFKLNPHTIHCWR